MSYVPQIFGIGLFDISNIKKCYRQITFLSSHRYALNDSSNYHKCSIKYNIGTCNTGNICKKEKELEQKEIQSISLFSCLKKMESIYS